MLWYEDKLSINEMGLGRLRKGRGIYGNDGANIRKICSPGDTILFNKKKDCCKCEQGCSYRNLPEDDRCPYEVVECEVEIVTYILSRKEVVVIINDCYEFKNTLCWNGNDNPYCINLNDGMCCSNFPIIVSKK